MGDIFVDDVIVNSGSETPGPVPGTLPARRGGRRRRAPSRRRPPPGSRQRRPQTCSRTVDISHHLRPGQGRLLPAIPGRHDPLRPRRRRVRHLGRHPDRLGHRGQRKRQTRLPRRQRNLRPGQRRLLPEIPGRHHPLRPGRRRLRHLGRHPGRVGAPWAPRTANSGTRSARKSAGWQRRLLPGIPGRHHPLAPGTGAFATWGGIRAAGARWATKTANSGTRSARKYAAWPSGGCYQRFQGGTIHSPRAPERSPPGAESAPPGQLKATKREGSATPPPTSSPSAAAGSPRPIRGDESPGPRPPAPGHVIRRRRPQRAQPVGCGTSLAMIGANRAGRAAVAGIVTQLAGSG